MIVQEISKAYESFFHFVLSLFFYSDYVLSQNCPPLAGNVDGNRNLNFDFIHTVETTARVLPS